MFVLVSTNLFTSLLRINGAVGILLLLRPISSLRYNKIQGFNAVSFVGKTNWKVIDTV